MSPTLEGIIPKTKSGNLSLKSSESPSSFNPTTRYRNPHVFSGASIAHLDKSGPATEISTSLNFPVSRL